MQRAHRARRRLVATSWSGMLGLVGLSCVGAPPPQPTTSAPPAATIEAHAPEPDEEAPLTRITVTLAENTLHVELELPVAWIPRGADGAELLFHDNTPFERAPHGFLDFLSQPWTGRFDAIDGFIRARWDVRLEHHLAGPVRGLDDVPHPTRGGWVLAGRAFIPRAIRLFDGRRIETPVELEVIANGDVIGSPDRNDDGLFMADTLEGVADALYVVGRFRTRSITQGQAHVTLVTSDYDDEALASMALMVSRALELGERELGPLPPAGLFFVHDRIPEGIDGSVTGRAVSVLSATPPTGRARADDGIVTVHELAHLWNRSETWWINEGFTRWWELRLTLLLDDASPSDAHAALTSIWQSYVQEARGRTVEASEELFGYEAGALIAFCAETRLRQSGSSLGAVHRVARAASPQSRTSTVTREAWMTALAAVSPEAREEAERLLSAVAPIDIVPCLDRAGLRLTRDGRVLPRRTPNAVSVFAPPP